MYPFKILFLRPFAYLASHYWNKSSMYPLKILLLQFYTYQAGPHGPKVPGFEGDRSRVEALGPCLELHCRKQGSLQLEKYVKLFVWTESIPKAELKKYIQNC